MKMQKMFMVLAVVPLLVVGSVQCDDRAVILARAKQISDNTAVIMPVWATRIVKWFNPTDEQCAVIKQAADACGNLLAKGAVKFSHPELSQSEQASLLSLMKRRASVLEFLDMAAAVTSPMAKIAFLRPAVYAHDLFDIGGGVEPLVFAMTKGEPRIQIPSYPWKAYRAMVVLLDLLKQSANDLHCLSNALGLMNDFIARVNEFDGRVAFLLWPEVVQYGFSSVDLGRGHTQLPSYAKMALLSCNGSLRWQGLTCFQHMLKYSVGVDAAVASLMAMDKTDFYRRELEKSLITVIREALKADKQSQTWAIRTLGDVLYALSDLRPAEEIFKSLPHGADTEARARLQSALMDEEYHRTPWYRRSIDTW